MIAGQILCSRPRVYVKGVKDETKVPEVPILSIFRFKVSSSSGHYLLIAPSSKHLAPSKIKYECKTYSKQNFNRNNNASSKDGVQWRGNRTSSNGHCNGSGNGMGAFDGTGDIEGGGEGKGSEGSAAAGPDQLEGPGSIENDPIHLKRRVGLVSGVALIVGTMIDTQQNETKNRLDPEFSCPRLDFLKEQDQSG
ncbi:hypothetical protein NQ317_011684 [Molorchus minor]|uniref:Uncharacterized protein n=1 Tax=Molorchus minor TaxID=1323400 RepID=A0ABQ9J0Q8_9CUCU|nr:hypothetical protein NQ317_011684 [Molorchus minor]